MEKNAVEGKRGIILGGVFHSLICFTRLSSTLGLFVVNFVNNPISTFRITRARIVPFSLESPHYLSCYLLIKETHLSQYCSAVRIIISNSNLIQIGSVKRLFYIS
jgi:hypothetical protein